MKIWTWFWFRPTDDDSFVALRTALGVVTLVWTVTLLPDLHDFQGANGLVPDRSVLDWELTVFRWFDGQGAALTLVWVGAFIGGAGLALGRGVRVAAPLAAICVASIEQDNPIISNAGDDLLRITLVYAAVAVVLIRASGAVRPLLGPRSDVLRSKVPIWGLRLFQFQLTAIYLATVVRKWPGSTWQDGEASLWALQLVRLERFPVPDLLAATEVGGRVMTWGVFGLEIVLPVLLWIPFTRKWGVILGLAMHAGFAYAMRLGVFSVIMAVNYLAFVDDGYVRSAVDRMRWWTRPGIESATDSGVA